MITAVSQTLADILAEGSPLIRAVQLDLSHPGKRQDIRPALSLYLYDLRESIHPGHASTYPSETDREVMTTSPPVIWYDLSFLIVAWDRTNLGEQRLLSEVLLLLLKRRLIDENELAPELKGYGHLPIQLTTTIPDVATLWRALGVPLQPALYVTIQIPFNTSLETARTLETYSGV